jgi:hypothetical protein
MATAALGSETQTANIRRNRRILLRRINRVFTFFFFLQNPEMKDRLKYLREYNAKRTIESKSIILKEKEKQGRCKCCDENLPEFLEFAHYCRSTKYTSKNGKKRGLDRLLTSPRIIAKELQLGRFLCMFCHRIETKRENDRLRFEELERVIHKVKNAMPGPKRCNGKLCQGRHRTQNSFYARSTICKDCMSFSCKLYRRRQLNYINNKKINIGECMNCKLPVSSINTFLFDFDHLREKNCDVSSLQGHKTEIIDTEIKKCQLLCCKCHLTKTQMQRKEQHICPQVSTD